MESNIKLNANLKKINNNEDDKLLFKEYKLNA